MGDKEYDGNHRDAVKLRGRGLFLCSTSVVLEHPSYNFRAGQEMWKGLEDSDKTTSFERSSCSLFEEDGKVMVKATVELPKKFNTFLDHSEAVFTKYGPTEQDHENICKETN